MAKIITVRTKDYRAAELSIQTVSRYDIAFSQRPLTSYIKRYELV